MLSSEMLQHVVLVRTDVSEERIASIIRLTRIGELGRTLAATCNRSMLQRNNRTWDLWVSSQEFWPLVHRGGPVPLCTVSACQWHWTSAFLLLFCCLIWFHIDMPFLQILRVPIRSWHSPVSYATPQYFTWGSDIIIWVVTWTVLESVLFFPGNACCSINQVLHALTDAICIYIWNFTLNN
jgi:hypothetical protein